MPVRLDVGVQTQIDDHDRRRALWDEDLRWYALKIQDMTG